MVDMFNEFLLVEPVLEQQTASGLFLPGLVDKNIRKGRLAFASKNSKFENEIGVTIFYAGMQENWVLESKPAEISLKLDSDEQAKTYHLIKENQVIMSLK